MPARDAPSLSLMAGTLIQHDLKTLIQTDKEEDECINCSNKREEENKESNKGNLRNDIVFPLVSVLCSVKQAIKQTNLNVNWNIVKQIPSTNEILILYLSNHVQNTY